MKPCKASLPDGTTCTNQVDEGQDYCPYHLSHQITPLKKILLLALPVLGLVAVEVLKGIASPKSE